MIRAKMEDHGHSVDIRGASREIMGDVRAILDSVRITAKGACKTQEKYEMFLAEYSVILSMQIGEMIKEVLDSHQERDEEEKEEHIKRIIGTITEAIRAKAEGKIREQKVCVARNKGGGKGKDGKKAMKKVIRAAEEAERARAAAGAEDELERRIRGEAGEDREDD